jgi:site-specific DNA-adenine methylase
MIEDIPPPFPFNSLKEAWDNFDGAAQNYFIALIKQESKNNKELINKIKLLKNPTYCARLLYILNMFAATGIVLEDKSVEFNLDWAMIMAKPFSVRQARQALQDMVELGLMEEIKSEDIKSNYKKIEKTKHDGGNTNSNTKFNFDV